MWNTATSLIREPTINHKIYIYYRFKLKYGNSMFVNEHGVWIYTEACCEHPDFWTTITEESIKERGEEELGKVLNYYDSLSESFRLDLCQKAYNAEYDNINSYNSYSPRRLYI